jgi:hypothetical protein
MKTQDIAANLEGFKQLLQLWVSFRKYFQRSFTSEPLSRQEEQEFLELKSTIAKNHRVLAQRSNELFYYGGDRILEILRQSISVSHLRALPMGDKRNLYKSWHTVFVYLSRTVGAYRFISEGFIPVYREKGEHAVSVVKIKAMAGTKGEQLRKKGKWRRKPTFHFFGSKNAWIIFVVIGVAVIAAGVYFAVSQL